jgi:organic hydroperoxide reductase OsmC/OhrA
MKEHAYTSQIRWTGNQGSGTSSYRAYTRSWDIVTAGKPTIHCSNDPNLGGDPSLPNPEDLLLSALSACHMLWYLHLASRAGIVVTAYDDEPLGIGRSDADGSGSFVRAVLRPTIEVLPGTDIAAADAIHHRIHEHCFIARSVRFPVSCEARYSEAPNPG